MFHPYWFIGGFATASALFIFKNWLKRKAIAEELKLKGFLKVEIDRILG